MSETLLKCESSNTSASCAIESIHNLKRRNLDSHVTEVKNYSTSFCVSCHTFMYFIVTMNAISILTLCAKSKGYIAMGSMLNYAKIWVADYVRYAVKSCNMTLARQQQSLENYINLLFLLSVNWCF